MGFVVEGALAQGLIFAFLAWGTYLTLRILKFADITVDGSFVTGGAVATLMLTKGHSPWLALLAALACGLAAGSLTGLIHTKLGVNDLLSGILVMTALWSINLRIMGGRSNASLMNTESVTSMLTAQGMTPERSWLWLGAGLAVAMFLILSWFLRTDFGMAVRGTGDNDVMARANGIDPNRIRVFGLAVSNGLVAVCGALMVQYQGFWDVNMGVGMLVVGVAALVIGETLFGWGRAWLLLAGVAVGAVVYRGLIAAAISARVEPMDMRLLTAVLVLIALAFPAVSRRLKEGRS